MKLSKYGCCQYILPFKIDEGMLNDRLLAGAYYNSGDNEGAEPYYEAAAEHHRNSSGEKDIVGIGVLYSKLGRCAYLRYDYEKRKNI